jgi:hypothetical protein
MSSNNNVMAIYQEIMEELSSKPMEIEFAQRTVMQRKAQLQNVTNQLDVMESNWVAGEGGYKAIGSNEKERDMRLMTLRNSFAFAPTMEVQRAATQSLDEAKIMAATLERQYEAICHKSRLTTGVMAYLGNLALPVGTAIVQAASAQLFDFPGSNTNDASPAVNDDNVSILDAEAIGL